MAYYSNNFDIHTVSLFGALSNPNFSTDINIGICVDIPLNIQVPTGSVGIDSNVNLSIYETEVAIAFKSS